MAGRDNVADLRRTARRLEKNLAALVPGSPDHAAALAHLERVKIALRHWEAVARGERKP